MELSTQAITAALNRDWKSAIDLNLRLLKSLPGDIDALNRLGRAYMETGQKTKAQLTYAKVLKIDKFNPIAQKSLALLKISRVSHSHPQYHGSAAPVFLEEPGVTKTVILTRLGAPQIVSRIHPGDPVVIQAREHCVSVMSASNEYLGRLPDDLASRLRLFIKGGNTYQAWIRSVDQQAGKQTLKIFIKEISRSPKFRNIASFPLTEKLTYAAFTPPELIHHDGPDTSATEERLDGISDSDPVDDEGEPVDIPEASE